MWHFCWLVHYSTSSGSRFPLSIEKHSSHRKPQVILLCKAPRVKEVPGTWYFHHCLPALLLEKQEHKPMDSYVWPWNFIVHHLISCSIACSRGKTKWKLYIYSLCKCACVYNKIQHLTKCGVRCAWDVCDYPVSY